MKVETQILIAKDLNYLDDRSTVELLEIAAETGRGFERFDSFAKEQDRILTTDHGTLATEHYANANYPRCS
jgi:hypothetical protein